MFFSSGKAFGSKDNFKSYGFFIINSELVGQIEKNMPYSLIRYVLLSRRRNFGGSIPLLFLSPPICYHDESAQNTYFRPGPGHFADVSLEQEGKK